MLFLESLEGILISALAEGSLIMEEYEDLENDAPDALDATTTTTRGHENEALYQSTDIARQLEAEMEKNHRYSVGVSRQRAETWPRG